MSKFQAIALLQSLLAGLCGELDRAASFLLALGLHSLETQLCRYLLLQDMVVHAHLVPKLLWKALFYPRMAQSNTRTYSLLWNPFQKGFDKVEKIDIQNPIFKRFAEDL